MVRRSPPGWNPWKISHCLRPYVGLGIRSSRRAIETRQLTHRSGVVCIATRMAPSYVESFEGLVPPANLHLVGRYQ